MMEMEEKYLTPAQREKLSPGLKMGIIKKKMGMKTKNPMTKGTKGTKRTKGTKAIPMAMKNYGK